MEKYIEIFLRENQPMQSESIADFMDRYVDWLVKRGACWPDGANRLRARVAALEEALRDIAYNTSLSVPPAYGGGPECESSFYRTGLQHCIGTAARALEGK